MTETVAWPVFEAPLVSREPVAERTMAFRLHYAARPAALLAGGIGTTSFRSILVETFRYGTLPYRVVLFHANHRPEDAAFADELRALGQAEPKFSFVPTTTAMAGSNEAWDGERGRIDATMLQRSSRRASLVTGY